MMQSLPEMLSMLENSQLAAMLDASNLCINAIDRDGHILYFSRAAAELEQIDREQIIGSKLADLYMTSEQRPIDPSTSAMLRAIQQKKAIHNYYMSYTIKGKQSSIIINAFPVFENGKLQGVIGIFQDVAQAKQNSLEIIEQERDLLLRKDDSGKALFYLKDIIYQSASMQKAIQIAMRAAENNLSVMITGETGTGKEMFAQGIHNQYASEKASFVAINCAAIPENLLESELFGTCKGAFTGAVDKPGLLELAKGGSLFLDEINSMPLYLQSKLLRVLQTRRFMRVGDNTEKDFNARLISAINCAPQEAVRKQQLREDIYYRLAVMQVHIPSLRKRPECIPLLSDHFLHKANRTLGKQVTGIPDKVRRIFQSYTWPGNVRELEHTIAYAVAMADYKKAELSFEMIPPYIMEACMCAYISTEETTVQEEPEEPLYEALHRLETDMILKKAAQYNGNISHMAMALGISRQNLHHRIKRLNLQIETQNK